MSTSHHGEFKATKQIYSMSSTGCMTSDGPKYLTPPPPSLPPIRNTRHGVQFGSCASHFEDDGKCMLLIAGLISLGLKTYIKIIRGIGKPYAQERNELGLILIRPSKL